MVARFACALRRSSAVSLFTAGILYGYTFAWIFGQGRGPLSIAHSEIVLASCATVQEKTAAHLLAEETNRRTGIQWPIEARPGSAPTEIIVVTAKEWPNEAAKYHLPRGVGSPALSPMAESFVLRSFVQRSRRYVLVYGRDDRGVLFGVGYLLRHLDMIRGAVTVHGGLASLDHAETPTYPIRGHQLGYRPKNNTFDAWTLKQFEQYIRDLAIFGTNTIELIPPHSDDEAISPLFPQPPLETMVGISAILARYGLDCSIWYPALDGDYTDPAVVKRAVASWGDIFQALPRIDAVFVPGGDPGHTAPATLFALLDKETQELHRWHPHAQMWVSPQSFDEAWLSEFFVLVRAHPAWLSGVVYGPEMRISPQQFRAMIPSDIPVRFYPDLAHTLSSQYPVSGWDPAFALTEGREPVDPRPTDEQTLFRAYASSMQGFVAYSEGVNDDVNNILWSAWGWNPATSADEILREYGRYFMSPTLSSTVASGIDGLEKNWRGRIVDNPSIALTFARLAPLENAGTMTSVTDWRVQQLLYRAHYDAYLQERARREAAVEKRVVRLLQHAASDPPAETLTRATALLRVTPNCSDSLQCRRVEALAADLFHSIGMQLSVPKFGASATDRGANLDRVDAPISDLPWLRVRIAAASAIKDRTAQAASLADTLQMIEPDNPLSDDLGLAGRHIHLEMGTDFAQDPSGLTGVYQSALTTPPVQPQPMYARTYAGTLYDMPLRLRYTGLDADAVYKVHVFYAADGSSYRLQANGTTVTLTCKDKLCSAADATLPAGMAAERTLTLEWSGIRGLGGNGRSLKISRVSLERMK